MTNTSLNGQDCSLSRAMQLLFELERIRVEAEREIKLAALRREHEARMWTSSLEEVASERFARVIVPVIAEGLKVAREFLAMVARPNGASADDQGDDDAGDAPEGEDRIIELDAPEFDED